MGLRASAQRLSLCLAGFKLPRQLVSFRNLLCRHLPLDNGDVFGGHFLTVSRSQGEPFKGFNGILGNSGSVSAITAEIQLGDRQSLFGGPADYPAIAAVCKKHGLKLISDSAQGFVGS